MGTFGAGLYCGDFAMDLKSAIRAVSRLPFDGDRLLEILRESEPVASGNPTDEDHTTFWLVAADQFARRGIESAEARDKALAIIDGGSDLGTLERLGMARAGLDERRRILDGLRSRLTTPSVQRRERAVLKGPQPFLMQVGDVLTYPTCYGHQINPYFPSIERQRHSTPDGVVAWRQDGWSAFVVVDRGRAFDFLTWYRPLTLTLAMRAPPQVATIVGMRWALRQAGTCSASHFRKMRLERISTLPLDPEKIREAFPGMRPGTRQAIDDISIANALDVGPAVRASAFCMPGERASALRPYRTIDGLGQLLSA